MIQSQTVISIVDNSGVHAVKCIHIIGKKSNAIGITGDFFLGIVQGNVISKRKKIVFKKGDIVQCCFVGGCKETITNKQNGIYSKYLINKAIIINKTKKAEPLGSRAFGSAGNLLKQISLIQISALFNKIILIMLNHLQFFFTHIVKKDLILQSDMNCSQNIPQINKVIFQISFKNTKFNLKYKLGFFYFLIEFLCTKSPIFSFSKKDVSVWSVRKNDVVSLCVSLQKKPMYDFLEKLTVFYIPNLKPFSALQFQNAFKNVLILKFSNLILFPELEREVFRFDRKKATNSFFDFKLVFILNSSYIDVISKKNLLKQIQFPIKLC